MKVVLFTSTERRHLHLVNYLAANLPVSLAVLQPKRKRPDQVVGSEPDVTLVREYIAERTREEERFFPGAEQPVVSTDTKILTLQDETVNSPNVVEAVRQCGPAIGVVFGSGIIREPLLSMLRMVNIHLGVSPYYRGAGTNFWAMYNGDFHLVGATLHYIDAGIDTGPIVCHAVPPLQAHDTPHTLGNRVIQHAVQQMVPVIVAAMDGEVPAIPQWQVPNSHYYRSRDFTPTVLREFLQRWNEGMVSRYLAEHDASQHPERIITWQSCLDAMAGRGS